MKEYKARLKGARLLAANGRAGRGTWYDMEAKPMHRGVLGRSCVKSPVGLALFQSSDPIGLREAGRAGKLFVPCCGAGLLNRCDELGR